MRLGVIDNIVILQVTLILFTYFQLYISSKACLMFKNVRVGDIVYKVSTIILETAYVIVVLMLIMRMGRLDDVVIVGCIVGGIFMTNIFFNARKRYWEQYITIAMIGSKLNEIVQTVYNEMKSNSNGEITEEAFNAAMNNLENNIDTEMSKHGDGGAIAKMDVSAYKQYAVALGISYGVVLWMLVMVFSVR